MSRRLIGYLIPFITVLVFSSSCTLYIPIPQYMVTSDSLKNRDDIPKVTENDSSHPLKIGHEGNIRTVHISSHQSCSTDTFRLKCGPLRIYKPIIQCVVNDKKKAYLELDTGCMFYFWINDRVAAKYQFAVYVPPDWKGVDNKGRPIEYGYSYIPKLNFGPVEARNQLCVYTGIHLSPPTTFSNAVPVGIPFLQKFSYILFDQEKYELEFSKKSNFRPAQDERWHSYPIIYESERIYVKIPIAGQEEKIFLDTGSIQLVLPESRWNTIKKRLKQEPKLKKTKALFVGCGKAFNGWRGTVSAIQIGDNMIQNLEVVVGPDNAAIFTNDQDRNNPGSIGMQCFKSTVMVLDFKHKSLWVKGK